MPEYAFWYKQGLDPQKKFKIIKDATSHKQAEEAAREWGNQYKPPAGTVGNRGITFCGVDEDPISFSATEVLARRIEPTNEVEWTAKTAIQRLAALTGKSEAEVREELRKGPQTPTLQEPPVLEKTGVLADTRRKLREQIGI